MFISIGNGKDWDQDPLCWLLCHLAEIVMITTLTIHMLTVHYTGLIFFLFSSKCGSRSNSWNIWNLYFDFFNDDIVLWLTDGDVHLQQIRKSWNFVFITYNEVILPDC